MIEYEMVGATYDFLYAKYSGRSPKELLKYAEIKPQSSFLDLCCGSNGRMSKAAFDMGATNVCSVDLNPLVAEMPLTHWKKDNLIKTPSTINDYIYYIYGGLGWYVFNSSVHDYLSTLLPITTFDTIACQQGINYWFNESDIKLVKSKLNKGGKFVFNTFWNEPRTIPVVKEYEINDIKYAEITVRAYDAIHHSVYVDGTPPHHTTFKWIPPEKFMTILVDIFGKDMVTLVRKGSTDIYIAEKQ
tara:strand:- start:12032 stop:12763 length:732 start_codon:yes stop_codon:yes gene_type:complete